MIWEDCNIQARWATESVSASFVEIHILFIALKSNFMVCYKEEEEKGRRKKRKGKKNKRKKERIGRGRRGSL